MLLSTCSQHPWLYKCEYICEINSNECNSVSRVYKILIDNWQLVLQRSRANSCSNLPHSQGMRCLCGHFFCLHINDFYSRNVPSNTKRIHKLFFHEISTLNSWNSSEKVNKQKFFNPLNFMETVNLGCRRSVNSNKEAWLLPWSHLSSAMVFPLYYFLLLLLTFSFYFVLCSLNSFLKPNQEMK